MPRLKDLTIRTGSWSSLREVKDIFRQIIDRGGRDQGLNSLTLRESPRAYDWDDPWGAVKDSSRVFQATRRTKVGVQQGAIWSARWPKKPAPEVHTRQTHGPPPVRTIKTPFDEEDDLLAEKTIEDHLDAIPPAVLSQLIETSKSHLHGPFPDREYHSYSIQTIQTTGGWNDKLAVYEAKWKEAGGLLPLLESQLQKRKEQGWKLWDMPLMESEVGQEGLLYERIMKAGAGN